MTSRLASLSGLAEYACCSFGLACISSGNYSRVQRICKTILVKQRRWLLLVRPHAALTVVATTCALGFACQRPVEPATLRVNQRGLVQRLTMAHPPEEERARTSDHEVLAANASTRQAGEPFPPEEPSTPEAPARSDEESGESYGGAPAESVDAETDERTPFSGRSVPTLGP